MESIENTAFYTVKEVADKLKVKPRQIYNIIQRKEICPVMVGKAIRISQSELDRYLNK